MWMKPPMLCMQTLSTVYMTSCGHGPLVTMTARCMPQSARCRSQASPATHKSAKTGCASIHVDPMHGSQVGARLLHGLVHVPGVQPLPHLRLGLGHHRGNRSPRSCHEGAPKGVSQRPVGLVAVLPVPCVVLVAACLLRLPLPLSMLLSSRRLVHPERLHAHLHLRAGMRMYFEMFI